MNLGWSLPLSFPALTPHVLGYDLCLLTFELCEFIYQTNFPHSLSQQTFNTEKVVLRSGV